MWKAGKESAKGKTKELVMSKLHHTHLITWHVDGDVNIEVSSKIKVVGVTSLLKWRN